MKYLGYFIIPIVVQLIFIIAKKESRGISQNDNIDIDFTEMRLPRVYAWIGVIDFIFFIGIFILMLIFPDDTAEVWVGVVFIGFAALSLGIITACSKWRINIYNDHIVYKTICGHSYKYLYTEIKSAKLSQNSLKIKTVNKTFYVDPHAIGMDLILEKFVENNIAVS
ncbi:MAG: DUF6560 family protein [Clostridiaceae bacterium]